MKKLILILHNIRSTYNVGAILRSCDALAVDEVIFAGYTPFLDKGLPHEQAKLRRQIHKTALGAEESIAWRRVADLSTYIVQLKQRNFQVLALEQTPDSHNLADGFRPTTDTALILGEEVHGIPSDILALCDQSLEIPMCGKKESFNVSVATGIALWEIRKSDLSGTRAHLRKP